MPRYDRNWRQAKIVPKSDITSDDYFGAISTFKDWLRRHREEIPEGAAEELDGIIKEKQDAIMIRRARNC